MLLRSNATLDVTALFQVDWSKVTDGCFPHHSRVDFSSSTFMQCDTLFCVRYRAHIIQNTDVRILLGSLTPMDRGPGALVGSMIDSRVGGLMPFSNQDFFTGQNLKWSSMCDIEKRWPDLDPASFETMRKTNPLGE
jgi:hypothetical protein